MKSLNRFLILPVLFLSLQACAESADVPVAIPKALEDSEDVPVKTLLQKGHTYARAFNEEKALEYFLAVEKRDPNNPDLLLAISREYRHLLSDASDEKEKMAYGKVALDYALKAAKFGAKNSEAQVAPGITYAKILALTSDSGKKLKLSKSIKASAERAIALDPKNDIAWHILGRWHRGYAEVGSGKRLLGSLFHGKIPTSTYEEAAACFLKASKISPNRLMHQIELGCVYAAMGKKDEAKKLIKKGLAMKETEKDDPETKRHGRETLKEL